MGETSISAETLFKLYAGTLAKLRLDKCNTLWAIEYSRRTVLKAKQIASLQGIGEPSTRFLEDNQITYGNLVDEVPVGENRIVHAGPCPLDILLVGDPRLMQSLLRAVFEDLEQLIAEEEGERVNTLVIETPWGEKLVVGASTPNKVVLGPIRETLKSLVAANVMAIERGRTPFMPVWLHPVTVAVVPASREQVEYARWISYSLTRRGVNNSLLEPPGSLGKRIRSAASYWIPYIVSVEARDAATASVTVRRKSRVGEQEVLALPDFLDEVTAILSFHGVLGSDLLA